MSACQVKIYRSRTLVHSIEVGQPTIVGRRDPKRNDPPPVQLTGGEFAKLVIAEGTEVRISRSIFRLTPHDGDGFSIENINRVAPLDLANDAPIAVGESQEFAREIVVEIGGEMALRISSVASGTDDDNHFRSLGSLETPSGSATIGSSVAQKGEHDAGHARSESSFSVMKTIDQFEVQDVKEITQMLRLALGVVQRAAGTSEFFQASAEATTQIVNLDHAMVLLRGSEADSVATAGNGALPDDWVVWKRFGTNSRARPRFFQRHLWFQC